MIFEDDTFYSLKPDTAHKSQQFLHSFYSKMTEPLGLLNLMAYVFGICWAFIMPMLAKQYGNGDSNVIVLSSICILTAIIGARLIQSLHWAKKDYSRIEFGLGNIVIFLGFALFTSGLVLVWLGENPKGMVGAYACLSALGFLNFALLAFKEIPSDTWHLDLPIEKRIQVLNARVFALMFLDFAVTWTLMVTGEGIKPIWTCLLLTPIIPAILLNIAHSHQLSALAQASHQQQLSGAREDRDPAGGHCRRGC